MKTIYRDAEFRCHVSNPKGDMEPLETNVFDGKCDAFIGGFRYILAGESWTRSDGVAFHGETVTPWKPYEELDAAQREYERQLLEDYETALAEIEAALGV